MHPSYSSYKNDINSFNCEEYLLNFHETNSNDIFFDFIKYYKEIENEDLKKPIFSQTTKFKKIPNNFKNYKYLKINRDKDEQKNMWIYENPIEENNKISILIKTYLNKISNDTYKKISVDFINELNEINNKNLFEIISNEILNKCLFDTKYRQLYINLCYKIWSNKQIHYNFVNIIKNEDSYFWESIYDNGKIIGPFTTDINAKNDVFIKLNFKKYFLNNIQKLYNSKDLSFENLSEEESFIKKKKILMLVELIGEMFLENFINIDIINIIIIDLLHLNNFTTIEDIEYESLYNLIKMIYDNNSNKKNNFDQYKIIFNEYINIIKNIIENVDLKKRTIFFMNDTIMMLKKLNNDTNSTNDNFNNTDINQSFSLDSSLFSGTNVKENANANVNNDNSKKMLLNMLKNNNINKDYIELYKKTNNIDKSDIIYKTVDLFISQKSLNKNIINILNDIKDYYNMNIVIEKIIGNINDILLDIPTANEKLIYLIENTNYQYNNKNNWIQLLKNINDDSDSSDNDSDSSDNDTDDSDNNSDDSDNDNDSSDKDKKNSIDDKDNNGKNIKK